jgi:hypothetical protein
LQHLSPPVHDAGSWSRSGNRSMFVAEVGEWRGAIATLPVDDAGKLEVRFLAADVEHYVVHGLFCCHLDPVEQGSLDTRASSACLRLLAALSSGDGMDTDLDIHVHLGCKDRTMNSHFDEEAFYRGIIVPRSGGAPALVDHEIASRVRGADSGDPKEGDVLEQSGVWDNPMARATMNWRGFVTPARFSSRAFPWSHPRVGRRVRILHRERPWIAKALDGGPSQLVDFIDAVPGDSPSIGYAGLASALRATQRLAWRNGRWPISAAAVRAYDLHRDPAHVFGRSRLKVMLILASLVPPSWLPKSPADWRHFEVLSDVLNSLVGGTPHWAIGLLRHTGGDWPALFSSLGVDPEIPDSFSLLLKDIGDMVDHVAKRVVAPVLQQRGILLEPRVGIVGCAMRLLTEKGGILLMNEKSRRWHEVHTRLPVPSTLAGLHDRWRALDDVFVAPNGLEIVFLTSVGELVEEGDAMSHCVGTYFDACREGQIHVASVRKPGEPIDRVATIEVVVRSGVPRIAQNRGGGNREASPDAVAAVEAWLERAVTNGVGRSLPDMDGRMYAAEPGHVFAMPTIGSPSDWKGVFRRDIARMTWVEMFDEIERMAMDAGGRLLEDAA